MDEKQARILDALLDLNRSGCVWRWQVPGANLNHKSTAYCFSDGDEIDGVWAFANLCNAFDPDDDYSDEGELVAIRATVSEDGPESYELIREGEIVARFLQEDVSWIWELTNEELEDLIG